MTQFLLQFVPLRYWVEEDAHGPWVLNIIRGKALKGVSPNVIHPDEMSAIQAILDMLGLERNRNEKNIDLIQPNLLMLRVVEKTNGSSIARGNTY